MISDRRIAERAILLTVTLGTMVAPLNSTMIAVVLPEVMLEFSADVFSAGWLVTSYLIVMASLQPAAGKLGDRLGRRRLILGGLAYFGLAPLAVLVPGSAYRRTVRSAGYTEERTPYIAICTVIDPPAPC